MPETDEPTELPELDLDTVVAEIYEEARRRRTSGEIPVTLERDLDAAFARVSPPAAGDDLAAVIERVERASFIDVDVPTASARPGVEPVKRVLRKGMAWYLRYVAQQVGALGSGVARGLQLLDQKVRDLEAVVPGADPRVLDELRHLPPQPVPGEWYELLAGELGPVRGRVLHAECAAGELVLALLAAGISAYGVDPHRELLGHATRRAADVRPEGALAHLRALPADTLGGLVLSGVTDTGPAGVQLAVADEAARTLGPGGRLVVIASDPGSWSPVRRDLAPGRPFHPDTWAHLLHARGFTGVRVERRGPSYAVLAGLPV